MDKQKFWQLWDSNPRPFGLVPKTSALDHSAKLPAYWECIRLLNFHTNDTPLTYKFFFKCIGLE